MAGVAGVLLLLLLGLELGPAEDEAELGEGRVLAERRVEAVDFGERVVIHRDVAFVGF